MRSTVRTASAAAAQGDIPLRSTTVASAVAALVGHFAVYCAGRRGGVRLRSTVQGSKSAAPVIPFAVYSGSYPFFLEVYSSNDAPGRCVTV